MTWCLKVRDVAEAVRVPRAFLSHVREEGGFTSQVATRLTRARVIVDALAFRAGDAFPDEIRKHLAGTDLFVVFASRKSLESAWVTFEVNEAEIRRLQGEPLRLIAITTDSPDTRDHLPAWLKVGLVEHAPTPARAADVISESLAALEAGARPDRLFIGRDRDLAQIRHVLIPPIGSPVPRIVVVHGLRGVGRRTFLDRALSDDWSLRGRPLLTLGQAESLDWLHLQLVTQAREFQNQEELGATLSAFRDLDDDSRATELAGLFKEVSVGNRAPVIVDDGFLMTDEGAFRPEVVAMFRAIAQLDDLFVGLVTPRAPQDLPDLPIAVYNLAALDQQATRSFLTQALRRSASEVDSSDVAKLAPWTEGYPPAILLAVDAVRRYGIKLTLADVPALKDLTLRVFGPMLARLRLSPSALRILRVLEPFAELPVDVITRVLGGESGAITSEVKDLVDLSLLTPKSLGVGLAPPLRQAVRQRLGELDDREFSQVLVSLRELYWPQDSTEPVPLPILEAVTIAVARSTDATALQQNLGIYELPSVLARMAREAYNSGKWERALQFALRVLQVDARREDALITVFKAYVRLEEWDQAQSALDRIGARGLVTRHYLRGFMEWKRHNLDSAISAFRSALAAGDRNLLVRHHLAYCLFLTGKSREARAVLEGMPQRATSRNRFFLDLLAQVLIRLGKPDEAEAICGDLQRYGFDADAHHRLAHVRLLQGRPEDALTESRAAVAAAPTRNEARVLEAEALIALGRSAEAQEALSAMTVRGPRDREMQQHQLCRLKTRLGQFNEAEAHWRMMRDHDSIDARRVRLDMIGTMLRTQDVDRVRRVELEAEREKLMQRPVDLSDLPIEVALDPDS